MARMKDKSSLMPRSHGAAIIRQDSGYYLNHSTIEGEKAFSVPTSISQSGTDWHCFASVTSMPASSLNIGSIGFP
ncbi:hypothetical protein J6590_105767, partial [Homalodisca vitripennis]